MVGLVLNTQCVLSKHQDTGQDTAKDDIHNIGYTSSNIYYKISCYTLHITLYWMDV